MGPPDFQDYEQALRRHGQTLVPLTIPVLDLTFVLGALHLALRHPQFPASMRPTLETVCQQAADYLAQVDPVIGQAMRASLDPAYDT